MSDLIERLRRAATPLEKGSVGVLPTRALYAEAADEIERIRSERAYIIGFNDGWESAHEQQPGDDSPFVEIAGFDPIDYALHYGGRCRDCADADGVCPSSGMPCDPSEARKAAGHVLKAWKYGIEHGYMDNPFATAIRRIKPSEAEGRQRDLLQKAKEQMAAMTPQQQEEMFARQRESFVRGMTTPCEHGVLDFEQCDQCRSALRDGGGE